MPRTDPKRWQRRQFLQTTGGLLAGAFSAALVRAEELPKNTNPRAIFGDSVEPDWKQRITMTVGPKEGDLVGAKDPHGKGTNIIQRTLIASSGNRFKLDGRLEERFHVGGDPRIATNFALLQCTNVTDVTIENITLDGNKAHNEMLDKGAFDDGSIRLDESNRITIRGVTVRNFYCDGI